MLRPIFCRTLLVLVCASVSATSGCSGKNRELPGGEASGTVTFNGKPVREGLITFMNEEAGLGDETKLDGEGRYAFKKPIPTGDYKVTIMPPVEKVREEKGPEVGVLKKMPDIPERYHNTTTTELRATVKEGKNTLDFDMKP